MTHLQLAVVKSKTFHELQRHSKLILSDAGLHFGVCPIDAIISYFNNGYLNDYSICCKAIRRNYQRYLNLKKYEKDLGMYVHHIISAFGLKRTKKLDVDVLESDHEKILELVEKYRGNVGHARLYLKLVKAGMPKLQIL